MVSVVFKEKLLRKSPAGDRRGVDRTHMSEMERPRREMARGSL